MPLPAPAPTQTNRPASTKEAREKSPKSVLGGSASTFALLAALIIGFQILALLATEGLLFLSGIGEEEVTLFDPELGFKHRTNKRITWRKEGYSQSYLDENGLRELGVKATKAAGTYRIALVGDSMVEGLQEPLDSTFGKIWERRLQSELKRPIEVLNFGTFGYSTVQEYLLLKRILPKFKPDLIVLCYDTRDMAETIESWAPDNLKPVGNRPYAIKLNGRDFVISTEPLLNASKQATFQFWERFEWFKQNSRIWGFFSTNKPKLSLHNSMIDVLFKLGTEPLAALDELNPFGSKASPEGSFKIDFFETENSKQELGPKKSQDAATARVLQMNAADSSGLLRRTYLKTLDDTMGCLLEKINEVCSNNGADLVIITMPGRSALVPTKTAAPSIHNIAYAEEIDLLEKHCHNLGIPLQDCHKDAGKLSRKEQEALFYILHLTKEGQRFVAENAYSLIHSRAKSSSMVH